MFRSTVAVATVLFMAAPALGQVPDHLNCYQIKDPVALSGIVDLNSPQFGVEPGCKISRAHFFCVPATKDVVSATDRTTGMPITPLPVSGADAGDRVCYKIRCPVNPPPNTLATDQFGTRTFTNFRTSLLCAPAATGAGFCGNGVIDPGEACDGTNFGGATCESAGFPYGGTLACVAGCTLDTSACHRAMLATGQTTCWGSSFTVIPCAGTGQDGDTQTGAPLAYMDNGDGTITDANTGLMWEKQSIGDGSVHDVFNYYSWDQAFSVHVATLNGLSFAGHSDWRVPNVRELLSIVNYENVCPPVSPAFNTDCTLPCTVLTCSCTWSDTYWSSSTSAAFPDSAWEVLFCRQEVF